MRHHIGLLIAPLTLSLVIAAQELPPGTTLPHETNRRQGLALESTGS